MPGLPRTFVGFSSTDINMYAMMLAWKTHRDIKFNFADCQLQTALDSKNEQYIKSKCRDRINLAGTYAMLIGQDTRFKHRYVIWEAEVALEQQCRIIGINLDHRRRLHWETCPEILRNVGAVFVPFSPHIVAHALEEFTRRSDQDWHYPDDIYSGLGYDIQGDRAIYRRPPRPWQT